MHGYIRFRGNIIPILSSHLQNSIFCGSEIQFWFLCHFVWKNPCNRSSQFGVSNATFM